MNQMIPSRMSDIHGGTTSASEFADPFLLPSSESFPTDFEGGMDFCQFLYWMNPIYRQTSKRVVGHFITDITFDGSKGDKVEQDTWRDYINEEVNIKGFLGEMGDDWSCFAGDTKVTTRNGVFPIRELKGKTVDVLSQGGVYREATFKSYGEQNLMEVEFPDGRRICATPEHQWVVKNGVGKEVRVRTDELCPGTHRIERTVAERPAKDEDYEHGVRHGFIYGDGSISCRGKGTTALFVGEKDSHMREHFRGHGHPAIERSDKPGYWRKHGFPTEYKDLPAADLSSSYWYGFVAGFLAADGSVDVHGCPVLTQKDAKTLQAIEDQLPRLGMVAGPIRSQRRRVDLTKWSGPDAVYDSTIHFMGLQKRFMQPEDFLIPQHRSNFDKHFNPKSNYGRFTGIKAVHPTNRKEEVFCCEEMATHTFVIGNGILTGNCYGNSFGHIYFPFRRILYDTRSGSRVEHALSHFENFPEGITYNWENLTYTVRDPRDFDKGGTGARTVDLPFCDRQSSDWTQIKLKRLDPRRVVLQSSFMSGRFRVVWEIEPELLSQIRSGVIYQVNDTPLEVLEAISKQQDYRFEEGEVFHMKAPTISGLSNFGWGVPEVLANYRNLHRLQVYRRIDEVVGMDYVLPFRLFTPNVSDANWNTQTNRTGLNEWKAHTDQMIKQRRVDPFKMYAMPFPTQMMEFGADGHQLVSKDNVAWHTDHLMDGMGYPAELFHGSLAIEQMPAALRIFENTFQFLPTNNNNLLKWFTLKVRNYLGMGALNPSMESPRMADDIEKRHVMLQMVAGGQVSKETGFKGWGIKDAVEEALKAQREEADIQRGTVKIQQELEREQMIGSMNDHIAQGEGAAGGGPGGGGGMTPLDVMDQAEAKAEELLAMPYQGERSKALMQLKQTDPQMHAMVSQKLEDRRSQGESAGRQMVAEGQM